MPMAGVQLSTAQEAQNTPKEEEGCDLAFYSWVALLTTVYPPTPSKPAALASFTQLQADNHHLDLGQ